LMLATLRALERGKSGNQRIGFSASHPSFSLTSPFARLTITRAPFSTIEQQKSILQDLLHIPPAMPKRKTESDNEDNGKKTKKEAYNPDSPSQSGKQEIAYDDLHGFGGTLKPVTDFRISPRVRELLAEKGITRLFPIQSDSYDVIYEGKDLIGRARTGTGKTLAFAIPVIEQLLLKMTEKDFYRGRKPRVLVLSPTRELAKQICAEFEFLSGDRLKTLPIYGGAPYELQERTLASGVDVVVGTPGRMLDHLEKGTLRLDDIQHVTLDEADEMLDMGFADDIESILKRIPKKTPKYQVLLFSATIPDWVREVARKYLDKDHTTIDLVGNSVMKSANTISHLAMLCIPTQRISVLGDLVKVYAKSGKTIIKFSCLGSDAFT